MSSFSYKNYFKPSPENIQRLVLALKTIIIAAAGTTWANGNPHYAAGILIAGAVLDEIAKFFAQVAEDEKKQEGAGQAPK